MWLPGLPATRIPGAATTVSTASVTMPMAQLQAMSSSSIPGRPATRTIHRLPPFLMAALWSPGRIIAVTAAAAATTFAVSVIALTASLQVMSSWPTHGRLAISIIRPLPALTTVSLSSPGVMRRPTLIARAMIRVDGVSTARCLQPAMPRVTLRLPSRVINSSSTLIQVVPSTTFK